MELAPLPAAALLALCPPAPPLLAAVPVGLLAEALARLAVGPAAPAFPEELAAEVEPFFFEAADALLVIGVDTFRPPESLSAVPQAVAKLKRPLKLTRSHADFEVVDRAASLTGVNKMFLLLWAAS